MILLYLRLQEVLGNRSITDGSKTSSNGGYPLLLVQCYIYYNIQYLPEKIKEQQEKLKAEMLGMCSMPNLVTMLCVCV